MPSDEFKRWTERFDARYRFGIPVLPTARDTRAERTATMPPTLVALPPRAGSMKFSDEDVAAVIDLLRQAQPGQAVRLTDNPDNTDNTARRRSELMKEQIEAKVTEPIKPGHKIRGHVLTAGDGTVKEHTSKKSGKSYKITHYPENWGAVSLVPESDPDPAPAENPDNGDNGDNPDTPPAENPSAENTENPATDAPDAPEPPAQGRQTRRRN